MIRGGGFSQISLGGCGVGVEKALSCLGILE